MSELKVFSIKKNIYEDNKKVAEETRGFLRENGAFMVNVMSSPGSGKTTTLVSTVKALKEEMNIGVIEADVDSDVDAKTVQEAGARAVQMHTDGLCHIDATMARAGVDALEVSDLDLVFLENIGNLICPVGYDTGAMKNIAILSVPEGDDKPLKYPMIFAKVDALLISKMDVMPYFDFDMEALKERVYQLNKDIEIFPLSAKTGEGMDAWTNWIRKQMGRK
ncbi:hydrogenase nickel incorporation protein HypB [Proteiniclasticum sp.]|jgi:hydrogenase nickel incorporation protein HypB|uniref:hydrogenase nickel incorporation protein HypB n=1 Tax=Proteiniclasticum sp. TaxID=2053595 RepID=UPI000E7D88DE|nr:hydrogenase nickel incorporation protein HypB [Proteiniclasticum sp.]HBW12723.1 hydrogenase accessory protein HypB [Proteiniclasticum sp.]